MTRRGWPEGSPLTAWTALVTKLRRPLRAPAIAELPARAWVQLGIELDPMQTRAQDDQQAGARDDVVQVDLLAFFGDALPREREQAPDDAAGALRLVVNHAEVLARRLPSKIRGAARVKAPSGRRST